VTMGGELSAMAAMNVILSGAIMMAYFVAGLFFIRFWQQTKDRLFVMFALAFWLLCVNYLLQPPALDQGYEVATRHYAIRFVAFLIILLGIIDKNYARRKR
jgi:hypothetical protein